MVKEDDTFIYVIAAGTAGYIGKTSGTRTRASFTPRSLIPRWSEHVRELHATLNHTVAPYRKRNRYVSLSNPQVGACLGIIAISNHPEAQASKAEAVGIAMSKFKANGSQFKHLVEQVRHSTRKPRTTTPRQRATVQSKQTASNKLLQDNLDTWGLMLTTTLPDMHYTKDSLKKHISSMTCGLLNVFTKNACRKFIFNHSAGYTAKAKLALGLR
jgi:hypothetical protein